MPSCGDANLGDRATPVSPAEQRFISGIKRLLPDYKYELSYFAKNRRSNEDITAFADSSSSGSPLASRSDKTE